ncbi:uncharacterized protein LOC118195857 isoform X1 [Stegodyphus dumicola]|uniref:uncharacterized protein LOC118195857 isoform X1 n=1 Tax=Stegodyphus dumicola TaxID=202533 RepID=UPI0015B25545|nr:uncharacterized protein LOC118195857 isoform X1 [Stegodyphus dumicola]
MKQDGLHRSCRKWQIHLSLWYTHVPNGSRASDTTDWKSAEFRKMEKALAPKALISRVSLVECGRMTMSSPQATCSDATPEIMAGNPSEASAEMDTSTSTDIDVPVSDTNLDHQMNPDDLLIQIKQLYLLKARFTDLEQNLSRARRSTPLASLTSSACNKNLRCKQNS